MHTIDILPVNVHKIYSSISEFRSHFLREVIHWKSQLQEVRVRQNKYLLDEVKKHSRRSHEIQFKGLNEKLRRNLPDQQINWTMPASTQKSLKKIEQLKESKTNKNILIVKTLEAFKHRAKIFSFKNTYFKNLFKNNICFWNRSSIISARPEKYSLALEYRLTRKWPKKLRKKEINCKLLKKYCWKL